MRITDDTRFPHPVLSPDSGDYVDGAFEVSFMWSEDLETGKVALGYEILLNHQPILDLVTSGYAKIGAFIRCQDTYYSSLEKLSWPNGNIDFPEGALLGRVEIRPMIWMTRPLASWSPAGVNEEFSLPLAFGEGDIIAIALEAILNVGRAKLVSLESIFTLRLRKDFGQETVQVDPSGSKIIIDAGIAAFAQINALRANASGRSVGLAAIYAPVVMEVLDHIRSSPETFDGCRWLLPFLAKCETIGIDPENPKLFEDAQKLLGNPILGMKIEGVTP